TKFINIKAWRQDMSRMWEEDKDRDVQYIVMSHSRPMFKVQPVYGDEMNFSDDEWSRKEYHALASKSFGFWTSEEDDNIFDETVKL
ncbi:MAG: hypothetical protein Q8P95_00930, partial [bacterium]|nr:hypothetical protein [bacterium]